jgi:hypothetical protein
MGKISIKDYYLGILAESDERLHIDETNVSDVADVAFDSEEDYIRLDFTTTFGKKMSLVTKYSQFKNWFGKCKEDNKEDIYTSFIKDFIRVSNEVIDDKEDSEEEVNEIIDDSGQIMDDNPMPINNASLAGTSVWDTDKVYAIVPRVSRMYMGDLGVGAVSW